jgi:hypothetical protein
MRFDTLTEIPTVSLIREKIWGWGGALLLLVVIIAGAALLFSQAQPLSQWATETEKYWAFIGTLTTVITAGIGLWFVWIRFIRKRDYALKLDITPTAGQIYLPDNQSFFHWCNVKLENKGAAAILYTLSVAPILFKGQTSTVLGDLTPATPLTNSYPVVDVGTIAEEHFTKIVPTADAEVVTFRIKVTAGEATWWSHITVSNVHEPKQPA